MPVSGSCLGSNIQKTPGNQLIFEGTINSTYYLDFGSFGAFVSKWLVTKKTTDISVKWSDIL